MSQPTKLVDAVHKALIGRTFDQRVVETRQDFVCRTFRVGRLKAERLLRAVETMRREAMD